VRDPLDHCARASGDAHTSPILKEGALDSGACSHIASHRRCDSSPRLSTHRGGERGATGARSTQVVLRIRRRDSSERGVASRATGRCSSRPSALVCEKTPPREPCRLVNENRGSAHTQRSARHVSERSVEIRGDQWRSALISGDRPPARDAVSRRDERHHACVSRRLGRPSSPSSSARAPPP